MIEVERKFRPTEEQKAALINGAAFVGEKTMTDIYYDTVDFQLTTNDRWLRQRDGAWELKEPLNTLSASKRAADQYRELTTEEEIRSALHLFPKNSLSIDLTNAGYQPFAPIKTTRRKYKKDGFVIDLDDMDFGYDIGEIELLVNDESEMAAGVAKIEAFAKQHGLGLTFIRGKILEYLHRFRPDHYQAVLRAGKI